MTEEELEPFLSDEQPNRRLTILYDRFREEFIAYVRKYYVIADEDIFEIYQNSFIAIWKKIRKKKLTVEQYSKVSLKTYLFNVGINLVKWRKPKIPVEPLPVEFPDPEPTPDKLMEAKERKEKVLREIMALGEPCSRILTLRYDEEKSMKEIAELMGKNEQVAKNMKCHYIKLLREKLNKD